jgi:hypothetical protein
VTGGPQCCSPSRDSADQVGKGEDSRTRTREAKLAIFLT